MKKLISIMLILSLAVFAQAKTTYILTEATENPVLSAVKTAVSTSAMDDKANYLGSAWSSSTKRLRLYFVEPLSAGDITKLKAIYPALTPDF